MNHYDDTPDTAVFYAPIPAGSGPGISTARCGCVLPTSCDSCRGDWIGTGSSVQRKQRKADVAEQWRSGRLTARDYYHLTAALSYDGLPDREAARAVAALGGLHGLDATGGAA